MNRRIFLVRSAACLLTGGWVARADDAQPADLTVAPNVPGRSIASDFLGLSYESSLLPSPDFFSPANRSLLALIHRLGSEGVIRIGGNSSEFTLWRPGGDAAPVPKRYVITPADIQRLAGFVRASGWELVYGLNLGTGRPEDAAAEAAAVARAVGDRLLAFQIGNEPDEFGPNGLRPKPFRVEAYLRDWKAFARAVQARVPNVALAGPDTASHVNWVTETARAEAENLALLTQHYYAEGPSSSPKVTIDRLFRSTSRLERYLKTLQEASAQAHRPYRLTEANSCYEGGKQGVSDAFASALWGADFLFQLAAAGGAGVNLHGGPVGAYTPIAQVSRTNPEYEPRPLYYGMLLFAQAMRGHLVSTTLRMPGKYFTAYAVRNALGELQIILINKGNTDVALTVDPGRFFIAGSVMRLTAPSLTSTTDVTLGGASVASDGSWTPVAGEEVRFQGRRFLFNIPAASAATVQLR